MAEVKPVSPEDVRRAREFLASAICEPHTSNWNLPQEVWHQIVFCMVAYAAAETERLQTELIQERLRIPQEFMDQLRDALKAPDDRMWFGNGLIEVVKTTVRKKEAAEAERDRLRKALEYLLKVYKANYSEGEKTPAIRMAEAALQGDSAGASSREGE